MLCPECEGTLIASTEPFIMKKDGEKKHYITYICDLCGFTDDYPAKLLKTKTNRN